jgi:outer membrane protein OmpA-like peptidoglycan-associated protein
MLPIPDGLLVRLIAPLLVLLLTGPLVRAQQPGRGQTFTDVRTGYQLTYPHGWQVHEETAPAVSFYAGTSWAAAPAVVRFGVQPLPASRVNRSPLALGHLDSLWQALTALPQAQVVGLEQQDAGPFQEVRYEYSFADSVGRRRVLGRRLWRGGYEFQLEYQAPAAQDAHYLPAARELVASFAFTGPGLPSRRYADQLCDDKLYGIAALRAHDGIWEDDCRTIHEWPGSASLAAAPKVHRKVLPFQSYALAKGFDNCLYSVTKSPTDQPEPVYRYNPATRRGEYTGWELPAQGPGNVWISAATDRRGNLYFQTSDAHLLVRVSPATDSVVTVWETDPLRQAAYYPAIGFAKAGTHANFGLDETGKLYDVYSADGALLTVDLATLRPGPELLPLDGLPEQGGYSDVLLEQDSTGRRRLLLAGPKSIFEVDLARRQATRVRRGVYTDLAGCSLFRATGPAAAVPAAVAAQGQWWGRVLDAVTRQPLPEAQVAFRGSGAPGGTPRLTAAGEFLFAGQAGQAYQVLAQLPGYFPADTTYRLPAGQSAHDIVLRPLAAGTTLRLDNVQFEQGKAVLLPSSTPDLNRLLTLLTGSPALTIELRGHTDNQGDPQLNVQLSEQRVAVVKAYLVSHGVAPERITGRGLGGAEPRASNEREETRRLNRRVEVRVTGGR